MSIQITHDGLIVINIALDAVASPAESFTTLLLLGDEANGTTLGGDRVRTYTSLTEVTADTAVLGDEIVAMATAAFTQRERQPSEIKIGRVDTVGAETYATALAAVSAVDDGWFGVCIESRLAADIVAVATAVEAMRRIFVFQSSDPDWLTAGIPAAFAAMEGYRNSVFVYHDTATVRHDVRHAASRLAWDPENGSAPWEARIAGGTDLATPLTAGQLAALKANNGNVALPYGSSPHYIDPGKTLEGRPVSDVVTAYWFHSRLRSRIADMKVAASARGEKVPVTTVGQGLLRSAVETQFALGVAANHFVEGQTEVTLPTIAAADLQQQRLRLRGRAQFVVSARTFEFDFNFSATALEDS